ncbi:hypothetical protein N0V93_010259 [Gnomoniopsis smithogilvyi]|uniref:Uncharacterized protein n=1 Tax=Gnomoniopsis smithogilvyi TaxID=1191159 RepID=A0A9W8YIF0_9PEZI|nr:hypothetical protein N0V93_010259 [Gnomoniopsis smithogilvyi]
MSASSSLFPSNLMSATKLFSRISVKRFEGPSYRSHGSVEKCFVVLLTARGGVVASLKSATDHNPWTDLGHISSETQQTYADLRDSGFPSDVFPEEQLLLDAPMVGDVDVSGADVFLAQANFLPGGILLALTTFHAATDGAGMLNITKVWAQNLRELQQLDSSNGPAPFRFSPRDLERKIPDQIWQRCQHDEPSKRSFNQDDRWLRGLVALNPGDDAKAIEDAVGTDSNTHKQGSPSRKHSRTMINRIMFLSSVDLAALQKTCAAEPVPAGTPPVSASDAIHALLWRTQIRARVAAAEARSFQLSATESVFESPVDIRISFGPNFPSAYAGNCWLLNTARMPVAKLIPPSTSLGHIAQVLREAGARVETRAIQDAYSLLQSTDDLSRVQGRFVDRLNSADFLVSNMIFFQMSEINFGSRYFGNNGMPQSVRVLHGQYAPYVRLGHVLPRNSSHGGVEISMNLFNDEMDFINKDQEFIRYLVGIDS